MVGLDVRKISSQPGVDSGLDVIIKIVYCKEESTVSMLYNRQPLRRLSGADSLGLLTRFRQSRVTAREIRCSASFSKLGSV